MVLEITIMAKWEDLQFKHGKFQKGFEKIGWWEAIMAENASIFDLQEISIFLGEMIRNAFRNGFRNGYTVMVI
jgi:hypothetical protein